MFTQKTDWICYCYQLICFWYFFIGFSDLAQHHEEIQSGVTFVKKKIIEDARNGEFDSVFLEDDMEVLAVDYINRPPEFLCQQGSVLIDFECGMAKYIFIFLWDKMFYKQLHIWKQQKALYKLLVCCN